MIRASAAVGFAGLGVMAAEILVSRLLAPSFGASLTTWAILIAVTLLLGALGAWLGGALAGKRSRTWLTTAFLVAAAGYGLAAGAFAVSLARDIVSLPMGTGVAALLLLLPIVLPLATVLPLASAVGTTAAASPRRVGRLVALSTLGSLVGTLGAALVLVPSMGLRAGFLALAAGAALTAVALAPTFGRRALAGALAAAFLLAIARSNEDPGSAFVRETAFGRVEIARNESAAQLRVDGILQGARSPLSVGPGALLRQRQYVELLPYLHPRGRRAVNIGLGTGLVPRMLEGYGIEVQSIDINPAIVDLTRTVLGYDGVVHLGDGRIVLRRMETRFDFVVLDAFQGEVLPAHLVTREAFAEARSHLEKGGILSVHLIGRPHHPATAAVATTLHAVFGHVLAVGAGVQDELQDIYLFASDSPLAVPPFPELAAAGWMGNEVFAPPMGGVVLTDDHNPIERLNEPLARALREASRPQTP